MQSKGTGSREIRQPALPIKRHHPQHFDFLVSLFGMHRAAANKTGGVRNNLVRNDKCGEVGDPLGFLLARQSANGSHEPTCSSLLVQAKQPFIR